jgi:SAM-dependent methyltransferase
LATYDDAAQWYDRLWGARRDYAQDVATIVRVVREHHASARRLLDVGCATGGHLDGLRRHFDCAGLDTSQALLRLAARKLGPEVDLHEADMADFQLDRSFDVIVCLWGSIAYASDTSQLASVAARMAAHLDRDGMVVVEPWLMDDAFGKDGTVTVTVDDRQEPVLAVVTATHRNGRLAELRRLYVAADPSAIETVEERHELGLFSRDEYVQAFEAAGFSVHWRHQGLTDRGLLIGVR